MKKFINYLFIIGIFFLFTLNVSANDIDSIKMDIYIDKNGNAHITESWSASLDSGTEGYHPYFNLGNATITDYTVKDETRNYNTISNWNINASLGEKAYKAGIYKTGNELDLCWGISNYGYHTYTLSYTINGFVAETDDSQIVYWTLIPPELSSKPDKVYIKIHADERFSDKLDVWGYGNYGGYAYVYDGYIELSKDNLNSSEYMTVLIKFEKGTFNTSNIIGNNFNYYYEMAEKGATHYKDKKGAFEIIIILFSVIFNLFIWIFVFYKLGKAISESANKSGSWSLDFSKTGKKLPKDIQYYRDIPCNKDIYYAYFVASNFNLVKNKTDFLGAILLKWLKENKIEVKKIEKNGLFKDKIETSIYFKDENFSNSLEKSLYDMMYEASKDGILEEKEFEKWCSSHYTKILNWFDKVLDYENEILLNEEKLTKYEVKTLGVFKSNKYLVEQSIYQDACKMAGLKKFLKEFSNIKDRTSIEVNLWEEYLMFAQIFGIAKEVAKEFKELYPDVITDYSYDSIIFVNHISYSGMSSASSARQRANSYSSGGGGFSSGGGGGGSFGGGGGGGGFR